MSTFRTFFPLSPEHLMMRIDDFKEGSKANRRIVVDKENSEIRVDLDNASQINGKGDFTLPIQRRYIIEAGAIMTEIERQYNDGGGNLNRYVPANLYEMIDWRRF